jgi:hypothetical protein
MNSAFVGQKNFDIIEMHGATTKKFVWIFVMSRRYDLMILRVAMWNVRLMMSMSVCLSSFMSHCSYV